MEKNHRGTAQKTEAGMMGQRRREQVQRGCAVGTMVLLAWLCRVLPLEGLPSGLQEACGILRLCNRQMFRVYRALSGRDLQSLKELHQQVWAPAPETPVLPAVQDAKLIQTGTSGWLADLMLGAGMVLSAAGYWMERKRKAMFYKSQH
ncbi:hypothetical protein [Faecalibacterium prausnitzii]|uniref:hypothetical protein n=1 Tax=Faecalibacterium prausnitzii TaxID=853 RepID=UPI001CBAFD65|nr:hypothetical protein [Faecalibacterium prausnitzii]